MPCLASLAIAGLLAVADEPPATIDWRAPPECPDAAEVAAMTTALLRSQSAAQVQLEVHATVVRAAGRFQLALELRSTHGQLQRALAADSCLLLARAVALVAAVHLDPLRVSQRFAEPVPPPLPAEADAAPTEPALPAPPTPPAIAAAGPVAPPAVDDERAPGLSRRTDSEFAPRAREIGGHLRVEGGLGHGVMPAVAGEVAALGGAWGPRWRVEAGFAAAPRREVIGAGGVGGRFDRLTAVLRGCAVWRAGPDRVAVHGCLGAELGAIGAVGTRGVTSPNPTWSPWAAVLAGPAARVRLVGALGLWFGVEAVVPLTRPTFTVGADAQTLFRGAPAGVRATVGLDVQIVARKRRARTTE